MNLTVLLGISWKGDVFLLHGGINAHFIFFDSVLMQGNGCGQYLFMTSTADTLSEVG